MNTIMAMHHEHEHEVAPDKSGLELPPEEAEYHEFSMAQAIPTKTGDEMDVSDVLSDDGRPGSAGTMNSAAAFEDQTADDEALLAANTATSRPRAVENFKHVHPASNGLTFKKTDLSTTTDTTPVFQFPKPARSTSGHSRTRKSAVPDHQTQAPGQPQVPVAAQPEPILDHSHGKPSAQLEYQYNMHDSYRFAKDEVQILEDMSAPAASVVTAVSAVYQPTINPTIQPPVTAYVDRRKRKKPKRREHTPYAVAQTFADAPAPALPLEQYSTVPTVTEYVESGPDHTTQEGVYQVSTVTEPANIGQVGSNVRTVYQPQPAEDHSDARHDAINLEEFRLVSTARASASTQYGKPRHEARHRRPAVHEQPITPPRSHPQQTIVTQDSSPNITMLHASIGLAIQRKENKLSNEMAAIKADAERQVQAATQANAELERRLTDDHSVAMNDAKKKAKRDLGMAQEAGKQLQSELDEAAREKDELTKTITELKVIVDRAKYLKTFTDGLARDFTDLKKGLPQLHASAAEALQARHDLEEQLRSCTDQLNAAKARNGWATVTLMDSQRWLRKAEADVETVRNELYAERERRVQLEQQLASITESKEDIQRAIQSGSDQLLSRLSNIETMMDERKRDETVTSMLQEVLQSIQDIDYSTSDATGDVTSARDSIERLIERYANGHNLGDLR